VGRKELIEWLNELLGLNYVNVEDAANGAAFCQVIDVVHRGDVHLNRVNFNASTEAERIENYKILQAAFNKADIRQNIDVKALSKGRMQAALELLQWIHGYWSQNGERRDYDGPERRRSAKCRDPSSRTLGDKRSAVPAKVARYSAPTPGSPSTAPPPPPVASPKPAPKPASVKPAPKAASLRGTEPVIARAVSQASRAPPGPPAAGEPRVGGARQEISRLKDEVEQMSQERDFYFDKLRRVEQVCQECEEDPLIKRILDILYETDPERGFLPPEEEDE
jgi:RP/EB family microtubule-associated protein